MNKVKNIIKKKQLKVIFATTILFIAIITLFYFLPERFSQENSSTSDSSLRSEENSESDDLESEGTFNAHSEEYEYMVWYISNLHTIESAFSSFREVSLKVSRAESFDEIFHNSEDSYLIFDKLVWDLNQMVATSIGFSELSNNLVEEHLRASIAWYITLRDRAVEVRDLEAVLVTATNNADMNLYLSKYPEALTKIEESYSDSMGLTMLLPNMLESSLKSDTDKRVDREKVVEAIDIIFRNYNVNSLEENQFKIPAAVAALRSILSNGL